MSKKEIRKSNLKFTGSIEGENNSMKELLEMPSVISRARKEMFESAQRQNSISVEALNIPNTFKSCEYMKNVLDNLKESGESELVQHILSSKCRISTCDEN